jgi:hypothetical protein
MPRLIIVAKRHERELRAAISAAAQAFSGSLAAAASQEVYEHIKRHLRNNHVPHDDRHMDPALLSAEQVSFHHD